uniref:Uncharacterized protein n=1 Tax=Chromera velia CCMP2878 TaxID=1169474 RepID=A0A0G4GUX9_9ALVE|eukprot:Cvel_23416.t1-p1 / transcript=Cvel_23416.t1 / gene=Cvel_23416 / organism=Chromera_velia_CCMP2878 / gene_product=hypothetical protein / transcript_product=hypothetical protein / location=Cvel_scaffold2411:15746-16261(+) / protein_length=172 / sequence_SO=supercontig / SO=protein_coding / is_pseudo=false
MVGGGVYRVAGEIFGCFMRFSSCSGTSRMTSAPMSASLIFSLSLYISRSCSGTCVMVVIADDSIVNFTCGGGGGDSGGRGAGSGTVPQGYLRALEWRSSALFLFSSLSFSNSSSSLTTNSAANFHSLKSLASSVAFHSSSLSCFFFSATTSLAASFYRFSSWTTASTSGVLL